MTKYGLPNLLQEIIPPSPDVNSMSCMWNVTVGSDKTTPMVGLDWNLAYSPSGMRMNNNGATADTYHTSAKKIYGKSCLAMEHVRHRVSESMRGLKFTERNTGSIYG